MITYKLKINYQDSKVLQSDMELVTGDVGAYLLECEFYDNGKRVDISDYLVTLKAKRADGVILSEGGKVVENKGIICLNNDIYSVPGELYLEIALSDSAKNYITTKIILANVLEGLGETKETSGNNSSVYVTLLNQIRGEVNTLRETLNEANSAVAETKEILKDIMQFKEEVTFLEQNTRIELENFADRVYTNTGLNLSELSMAYPESHTKSSNGKYLFVYSRKLGYSQGVKHNSTLCIPLMVFRGGKFNISAVMNYQVDLYRSKTHLFIDEAEILVNDNTYKEELSNLKNQIPSDDFVSEVYPMCLYNAENVYLSKGIHILKIKIDGIYPFGEEYEPNFGTQAALDYVEFTRAEETEID